MTRGEAPPETRMVGAGEGRRGKGTPRERDRVTSWGRIGCSAVSGRIGALSGPVGSRVSNPRNGRSPKVEQGALQPGIDEAGRDGPQCSWAPAR